jgi:oleate hydratase
LREKLVECRPTFGNPATFNNFVAQSDWISFTARLRDPAFFDEIQRFSGNEAGTGGLAKFKDSNWTMPSVLSHSPHFANQPTDVRVFWGYGLFPHRVSTFVAKSMADCKGAELLQELCRRP